VQSTDFVVEKVVVLGLLVVLECYSMAYNILINSKFAAIICNLLSVPST